MRIAITGSTGLVGTALGERLRAGGHEVVPVRRGARERGGMWDPEQGWIAPGTFRDVDAIVHLAGASIGDGRWTAARRRVLRASRIDATRLLVDHLATLDQRPHVLVCASAVGFYGDRDDEVLAEDAERGTGFLADLVVDWEAEATRAEALGIRVVTARSGVILAEHGGALPRMLLPFRLGLGGRLGSGRQWMPWVTLNDEVRALEFAVQHESIHGAINIASPEAATNADFTRALGHALRRPTLLPTPAFALRLLLGPTADELLLASTRATPTALQRAGFTFEDAALDEALPRVLGSAGASAVVHAR